MTTLAPSCVANPSAFLDGVTVTLAILAAALAVHTWRTHRTRRRRR